MDPCTSTPPPPLQGRGEVGRRGWSGRGDDQNRTLILAGTFRTASYWRTPRIQICRCNINMNINILFIDFVRAQELKVGFGVDVVFVASKNLVAALCRALVSVKDCRASKTRYKDFFCRLVVDHSGRSWQLVTAEASQGRAGLIVALETYSILLIAAFVAKTH